MYKLILRCYIFVLAFYVILSSSLPKLFLTTSSGQLETLLNKKFYYSALTSSEVKALSKKIFIDIKYRNSSVIKQNRSLFYLTFTKEGKILGADQIENLYSLRSNIKK